MPDSIAAYIYERKIKTPQEAAVLADEYILTHKNIFGEGDVNVQQNSCSACTGKPFVSYGESVSSGPEHIVLGRKMIPVGLVITL